MKVWNFEDKETKPQYFLKFQMGDTEGYRKECLHLVIVDADGKGVSCGNIFAITTTGKLDLFGGINATVAERMGLKLGSGDKIAIA